ncbi:hexokinase type 2 [Schistocerca piceifrons]|uniref:hexokinase type 2 n=1 Tax=Schistocerca piceifrons TaxID=274613 RepID=UPI001F5FA0E2|nr:hexokinase type 2 [Schistocerca piceifrons]
MRHTLDLQEPLSIREQCKELMLSDHQIHQIMDRLLEDIKLGLGKETHAKAIVKCFVTYVQDLPNGKEQGKFLALDLGGTNFRVLIIELEGEKFHMDSKIYAIPQSIMLGTGVQLFDHIAECLANFMKEHQMAHLRLPLGFTFSFPLTQKGLTKGYLERWTKGFNCSGCVGEDVVQLLKDALARRNDVQIDVCGILNDTTGTLMSCAWKNHNCRIGLIVGMFRFLSVCHMLGNASLELQNYFPVLKLICLYYRFEKMISGMYMGELVRLALVKFTKSNLLFGGRGSDLLFKRGNFFTKYVSEIESDKRGSYTNCRQVLEELGLNHATDQDCSNVRFICECVSRRAAHLVSAGVATLLNKMDEENVTVGIDGSVYRFHPRFHDSYMVEKISELVKPGIKFDLMLSHDGSGRGAALVAAVATRER